MTVSIKDFLNELASAAPSPGGGSAAALSAAIGAALVEKVATLNASKPGARPDRAIRGIRERLYDLISLDKEAFLALSSFKADQRSGEGYEKAVLNAVHVPVEICKLSSQALEDAVFETGRTGKWLYSDLIEAALLLQASFESCRLTAESNLRSVHDASLRDGITRTLDACEAALRHSREAVVGKLISEIRPTKVLNGRELAAHYMDFFGKEILELKAAGQSLSLTTIRIGEAKDAALYSQSIARLLAKLKIGHNELIFPEHAAEEDVLMGISKANKDKAVTGILLFSPIPKSIPASNLTNAIAPEKDVEGRRMLTGDWVVSPTANAVTALLESTKEEIAGKHAVIVGHSDLVGKPVSILLLDKFATVTVCHVKTRDLEAQVRKADIVVSAAGKAQLIKGAWIKPGAIVIDVGENFVDGHLTGDVEFEKARERASFITPVPGGVGPMTNVMLVRNLIKLHQYQTL